jgi:hypothetical protein
MKSKKTFLASSIFGRSSLNCHEDQKTISRNKMPFSSGPFLHVFRTKSDGEVDGLA